MITHLSKQMSPEVGYELHIMIITNYELKHLMMSHLHVKKICHFKDGHGHLGRHHFGQLQRLIDYN
jgi:hypothetical protein